MNNRITIGNFPIDTLVANEILSEISKSISSNTQLTITYGEFNQVVQTSRKPEIVNYFSSSDIIMYCGFGIYKAGRFLFGKNVFRTRQVGIDFYYDILKLANENKWKIFFLGSNDSVLNDLIIKIENRFPNLVIAGTQNGYFTSNDEVISKINSSNPDLIFVGMSTPKQEEWIYENKNKVNAKILLSVGNGINVLSGNYFRPNKFIIKIGFEWFFRLLREPKRLWKRYLIGIPMFFFIILKQKYFKK
ncbi:MAG: WecB/TagA/CpsF family glycosyltransferase [Bacteroidota bacterium]